MFYGSSIDLLWCHNDVAGWLDAASCRLRRSRGSHSQYAWHREQADQDAREQDDAKWTMVHIRFLS